MIRIDRAVVREIQMPLVEPFAISSGTQTRRRILLLELTDADGVPGWSECVAMERPIYLPETVDTAWLALTEWILPRIVGHPVAGPEEVHPLLASGIRGHEMAKAALEMGVWELTARRRGVPLAKLLGGNRARVAVGVSIGLQPTPEALAERARRHLEEGFRKIKLKIKPGQDVDYVAAVRRTLGDAAPLAVDANSAYTLDDLETLRRLDELGLMMIEQPLAWTDLVRHAELQRQLETPLCLDESVTSLGRAEEMVSLGSGRVLNVKPGRVGGFWASIAIHDLAMAHGIPVWCGGMLESGVGRAHNVALASLPNFRLPGDISPSRRYWERDIVAPEWTMSEDGMVTVPLDRPGMGVEVDLERVEALTVRRSVH